MNFPHASGLECEGEEALRERIPDCNPCAGLVGVENAAGIFAFRRATASVTNRGFGAALHATACGATRLPRSLSAPEERLRFATGVSSPGPEKLKPPTRSPSAARPGSGVLAVKKAMRGVPCVASSIGIRLRGSSATPPGCQGTPGAPGCTSEKIGFVLASLVWLNMATLCDHRSYPEGHRPRRGQLRNLCFVVGGT